MDLHQILEGGNLGLSPPSPLVKGGTPSNFFLPGDDALRPWFVKQYTSRQLNRKGRMPNYRMSRGKRVADGVIRILISSLSVLLSIME